MTESGKVEIRELQGVITVISLGDELFLSMDDRFPLRLWGDKPGGVRLIPVEDGDFFYDITGHTTWKIEAI